MKHYIKSVLLVIIVLFVTVHAEAQEKRFTYGGRIGVNISDLSGAIDAGTKVAVTGGLIFDYALDPITYLHSGLIYSLDGAKIGDARVDIHNLKIPVHFGYKIPIQEQYKLFIHGGAHVAYALDGSFNINDESVKLYDDKMADVLGVTYKRFDFGLGLGAEIEYQNFCLGINADFGMLNLVDVKNKALLQTLYNVEDVTTRNTSIGICLGYKF